TSVAPRERGVRPSDGAPPSCDGSSAATSTSCRPGSRLRSLSTASLKDAPAWSPMMHPPASPAPCAYGVLPCFGATVGSEEEHSLAHRLARDALPGERIQVHLGTVLRTTCIVDAAARGVGLVVHDRPAVRFAERKVEHALDDLARPGIGIRHVGASVA